MKTDTFVFFVILCTLGHFNTGQGGRRQMPFQKEDNSMDVTDFSVYYNLKTNATIKEMMPRPWYQPGWQLRLPFKGGRCSCDTFQCNCCSGMRVTKLGFNRETCAVLNFDQNEGLLGLEVRMNNETILNRTYSGANAPPFCIPIPIAGVPIPLLDMCIRLFDITLHWDKMHVCMDWDTRIDKAPVVILHFDCMDFGIGGVSLSKPDSSNIALGDESTTEPPQLDADVYDPVIEIENPSTKSPICNYSIKHV